MALVVLRNVAELGAQASLSRGGRLSDALARISRPPEPSNSSTVTISPAGQALATRMREQMRAQNGGVELSQTTDGALGQMQGLLSRAAELVTQQGAAGTSATDREKIQTEIDAISGELGNITKNTSNGNGQRLFDGTFTATAGGQTLALPDLAKSLGLQDGALQSVEGIQKAQKTLDNLRTEIGSTVQRMATGQNNAAAPSSSTANTSSSGTRDFEGEMAAYMRLAPGNRTAVLQDAREGSVLQQIRMAG
jgi:flagellin-like hook-associated protein FlgL